MLKLGKPLKVSLLPENICMAVTDIAGKKLKVSPLFTIKQTRHERFVSSSHTGKGTPGETSEEIDQTGQKESSSDVVALSIDEVAIYEGAVRLADETKWVDDFFELEAELLPGHDIEELVPLAQLLTELDGLTPEKDSKFIHALAVISQTMPEGSCMGTDAKQPAKTRGIQITTHIAEAYRLIWREQFTQMLLTESGVRRDDDIEHVHEMRVAIRRMRAAYLLFGRFFTAETINPLVKNLRRTAKALGHVRDLDVALDKLARYSKRLGKDEQADLQPLAEHWQHQRTQCIPELLTWLDSGEYRRFLTKLSEFCKTPGQGIKQRYASVSQPPEATQVRHVFPLMLLDRFLAVRKYEALFDISRTAEEPFIEIDTLHALRIEVKYLRYGLEFASTLLGEEGPHFVQQLKKLQNLLGDLNDASVARDMLLALPKKVQTKAVKTYIKRQDKVIRKIEQQADSTLRTFLADENRARLGTMIGRI
ncbi:CHAD domain-containing protein [Chloroflexi bacterium TSY]|nr:CHAD domain-containing protein [Chloroflexi bacterium TSY]